MSSEDRPVLPVPSAPSTASIPVYTVYPVASGERRGNANHGFHGSCPQEPPPKYEDVISGTSTELRPPPPPPGRVNGGAEPVGVIFFAPVRKYSRTQNAIGLVFFAIFLTVFVSFLVKFFKF